MGVVPTLVATVAAWGAPPSPSPYSYHGCLEEPAKSMRWCDTTISHEERLDWLMSQLTLEEKIGLVSPNVKIGEMCNDHTQGVPRLGVPPYMWLVEANTGAASACLPSGKCATTFNGPLGMGASFNRSSWAAKGRVLGTELRAFNNIGWHRDAGTGTNLIGLTGYGPNINNPRDPRFGRLSELPSEDPYHLGHYAVEFLRGSQAEDVNGYPLAITFLKHFTAYSMETNRMHSNFNISLFDFFDTYLPQYAIAFKEGNAQGVMCSYDAENGRPSCANDWLLNTVLRGRWQQPDAFVSTDCGVVRNLKGPPVNVKDNATASAYTINNGTDLEMGTDLMYTGLGLAVAAGQVNETTITTAARRTLVPLFKAGLYDPLDSSEWTKLGEDDVASAAHHQVRDEAAAQSFVLLKNEGVLPLVPGKSIAVVGPISTAHDLFSDYLGDQVCPGTLPGKRPPKNFNCSTTIFDAIKAINSGGTTVNATGCSISGLLEPGIAEAVEVASKADIVVLALGIDRTVEHEGVDRKSIELPGKQEILATAIYALKKPTVLVLTNGGPLAIDDIQSGAGAIVEAFNPGFGAPMLARTLFGRENRWGKLPYTIYTKDYTDEVDFSNYEMAKPPGRTYRYYTGTPLYRYGFGLSYSTFTLKCGGGGKDFPMQFSCTVVNTGTMAGDEVVQVYHSAGAAIRATAPYPVPIRSLVDFDRVSLAPGASAQLTFALQETAFELVQGDGNLTLVPGDRTVVFSRGTGADVVIPVSL